MGHMATHGWRSQEALHHYWNCSRKLHGHSRSSLLQEPKEENGFQHHSDSSVYQPWTFQQYTFSFGSAPLHSPVPQLYYSHMVEIYWSSHCGKQRAYCSLILWVRHNPFIRSQIEALTPIHKLGSDKFWHACLRNRLMPSIFCSRLRGWKVGNTRPTWYWYQKIQNARQFLVLRFDSAS